MRAAIALLVVCACGTSSPSTNDAGGVDAAAQDVATTNDGTTTNDAGTTTSCKRGIAANAIPTNAFITTAPGISWWYDWSNALPQNDVLQQVGDVATAQVGVTAEEVGGGSG